MPGPRHVARDPGWYPVFEIPFPSAGAAPRPGSS